MMRIDKVTQEVTNKKEENNSKKNKKMIED
jgi:hypothetical protein